MAKQATMTPAECETELGARGSLRVDANNRRTVRKWLNSQGFPSLFSGGLSMQELGLAYNDTTGRAIENLKRKLAETAQDESGEAFGAVEETASEEPAGTKDGEPVRAATVQAAPSATQQTTVANDPNAQQRMVAAIVAAMSAMPPQGVDEKAVKAIAEKAVADLSMTPDAIRALVELEAPKHVNVTRIEVKLPDADAYQELEGEHHPMFAMLMKAATSRQADGHHPNVWISGPAGSGKTFAAKMVAKAIGADFYYNGALSMPHELLGFIDAGGTYHGTPFRQGYTGKAVYLFDEVDGSDNSALLALNAALANGRASFPNGQCDRHQDSIIIATANTWGLGATADYVGRAKIDAAFLSRFPVRIGWDYDEKLEQKICGNVEWAKRVQRARAKARTAGIKVLIDPRTSIAGAALIANGLSADEAAQFTYLANLTTEQRTMVGG